MQIKIFLKIYILFHHQDNIQIKLYFNPIKLNIKI